MKYILYFLFSILIMALTGCASKDYTPVPVSYECPKIVLPPLPSLPTSKLNKNSTNSEVVKAYVSSLKHMLNWSRIVKRQVDKS